MFKVIQGKYIIGVCTSKMENSIEITDEEYEKILLAIKTKPTDINMHIYMLDNLTYQYEAVERVDPIKEKRYTLDEAVDIIVQEVSKK